MEKVFDVPKNWVGRGGGGRSPKLICSTKKIFGTGRTQSEKVGQISFRPPNFFLPVRPWLYYCYFLYIIYYGTTAVHLLGLLAYRTKRNCKSKHRVMLFYSIPITGILQRIMVLSSRKVSLVRRINYGYLSSLQTKNNVYWNRKRNF